MATDNPNPRGFMLGNTFVDLERVVMVHVSIATYDDDPVGDLPPLRMTAIYFDGVGRAVDISYDERSHMELLRALMFYRSGK